MSQLRNAGRHVLKAHHAQQSQTLVGTVRIRRELGYRPLYPSVYAAREAGAL